MVSSKVIKAPETLFEREIRGSDVRHTLAFRAALQSLVEEFSCRPCIMKSFPKFFRGPYRKAMKVATKQTVEPTRQERCWKLFVPIPRLLFFKHARGGLVGKEKIANRYNMSRL